MAASAIRRVSVCVLTRGRTDLLKETLASLAGMHVPPQVELSLVVLENGPSTNLDINELSSITGPVPLFIGHEVRQGIPYARNAAVRLALHRQADLIAFVDDDEVVDKQWLSELISRGDDAGSLLTGGPILTAERPSNLSIWKTILYDGIARRHAAKADRAKRELEAGREQMIVITTGNWMANASVFREHSIWFDETIGTGSGSDAAFFQRVREAGIKTAWAMNAVVYENIRPPRISAQYQFVRAREQSISNYFKKSRKRQQYLGRVALTVLSRLAIAGLLMLLVPVTLGWTLVPAIRSAGWAAGRVLAVLGATSRLYEIERERYISPDEVA